MHIFRRAILYLTRKKGKAIILVSLFFFISMMLVLGVTILAGTQQASKDLRSNIGAAFYIRPYEQFKGNNGELTSLGTPMITQESIERVKEITGGELKEYNTEHYGYVKGKNISFLAGTGHTEDSNMGKVTAVRNSELTEEFLNGSHVLSEGRHIKPNDNNKILITKELAEENGLKVGDTIELTHADFDVVDNIYVDLIKEKTAFAKVEVIGIYEIKDQADEGFAPTAAKEENHILSDSHLLIQLTEQTKDVFEGEISFFIADPLHLPEMIKKVEDISTIDWKNHILVDNDFQYSKIAGELSNIQELVLTLIVVASALSLIVLMLILIMRIRGRIREAGILLALGKTKSEILGQFMIETAILLFAGFIFTLILIVPISNTLNEILFGSLVSDAPIGVLQTGGNTRNYLQPNILRFFTIFGGELVAVILAVLSSSGAILSMKPKEILTKMS